MPPAISDEDTSDVEMTSAIGSRSAKGKKPVNYKVAAIDSEDEDQVAVENGEEDGEEDEDGEEGDPEVYVVERILSHRFEKGVLKFEVKWEGYDKKSDRTWEPEENLADATVVVEEYYEKVGGKDKIYEDAKNALKSKKRGRPSRSDTPTSNKMARRNGDHPGNTSPPATAKQVEWKPPAGSWEDEVVELDACEDEDTGKIMVYLSWKNGHKTQHETSIIYKRCPQKMLQFYEQHVRIIRKDSKEPFDASQYE